MVLSNLESYLVQTDSGIRWLGSIPSHWILSRVKFLLRERDRRAGENGGILLSLTRTRGLLPQADLSTRLARVEDLSNYKVCRPKDLVMNRMQAWSGMFAVSQYHGVVSPDYSVFETIMPSEASFFEYLFKTPLMVSEFASRSKGIGSGFNRLYTNDFGDIKIAFPPVSEQESIVRFLDSANGYIQNCIRAKQKLIALLAQQKCAIINHAVTRGLNPTVRSKPSSVEWLGEVPAHWTVRRLRNTCSMRVSNVDKHKRDNELLVRLCNYVDVYKNDRIRFDLNFMYATATRDQIERFRLRCGDVLITKDSESWSDIGVPALVEDSHDDLLSGYHLALLRPFPRQLNSAYLFYAFQAEGVSHQIHSSANGVTRFGLSHNAIKSVWIPVPPITEQVAIASFLDRVISDIDKATKFAQQEISLLTEYRTRLIADIVTGKLDVREAVAYTQESFDESDSTIARDLRVHFTEDESADVLETKTCR